jgi:hypothetical protein
MASNPFDLKKIRAAVRALRYDLRLHAWQRAHERRITVEMIKEVIQRGEIIEKYPDARPYPKCLLMHFIEPNKPLYVSLAYNKKRDFVFIITVHWFDPSKWIDPWTRR